MNQHLKIEKLGVIGAGQMGKGIALASLPVCNTILMKDVSPDLTAASINALYGFLDKQVGKNKITTTQRDSLFAKLIPCEDYSLFKDCDLVIETVVEDLEVKRRVLGEVEDATGPDTIFASNTSALPINKIAQGCFRPQNVLGMHYFSPVHLMPLLEIITTPLTDDWVKNSAVSFGVLQKKKCVVVKDGPAFYTTRILAAMLNRAGILLEQGVNPHLIDEALVEFGFPVGPVTLLDEVGIDTVHHVTAMLKDFWAERGVKVSGIFELMFQKGYFGRKSGKGFYRYDVSKEGDRRKLNPDAIQEPGTDKTETTTRAIADRVAYSMVNEAVYCFEEEIIASPEDGDTAAVLGLGFPARGPFNHIDTEGAGPVVEKLGKLESECGPAFKPSRGLVEMAAASGKFYD